MGVISNGTTLLDAGSLDSGVAVGKLTHIKTLTASSSANLTFTLNLLPPCYGFVYLQYLLRTPDFPKFYQENVLLLI